MTSRYIFEHNEVDLDLTITSNNIQIFMMIYDIFIHFITHLRISLSNFSVHPIFLFIIGVYIVSSLICCYSILLWNIWTVYTGNDIARRIEEMTFVYSMYLNIFIPLIDVYFSLTRLCILHQRDPKENNFTATKECI